MKKDYAFGYRCMGPPDIITRDAGKNFVSREFRRNAHSINTITKDLPVEAHWSIGLVERAHAILRRAYRIIIYVSYAYPFVEVVFRIVHSPKFKD